MSRRRFLKLACTGSSALLAGCSPLALLNGTIPSATYQLRRDIPYGTDPRQRLDVYLPASHPARAPVVVFFYGGNWNSGARGDYLFVGEALAAKGCIAVIPDYRLYPAVGYPGFLADSAQAVAHAAREAAGWGGDPEQLFVAGHSAGAYNAAMVALDPRLLQATGTAVRLRGLVGLAGPYDFLPLQSDLTKAIFGYPNTSITTQPIYYASAAAPPALLLTGGEDDVVDPGNSTRLARRLHEVGAHARVMVYPKLGHRKLIGALAAPLRSWAPVLDDIAAFVHPA